MNMQASDARQSFVIQTDEEKMEAIHKASADDAARRLKLKFTETQKPGAADNPEVGCVAWYQFPKAGV